MSLVLCQAALPNRETVVLNRTISRGKFCMRATAADTPPRFRPTFFGMCIGPRFAYVQMFQTRLPFWPARSFSTWLTATRLLGPEEQGSKRSSSAQLERTGNSTEIHNSPITNHLRPTLKLSAREKF